MDTPLPPAPADDAPRDAAEEARLDAFAAELREAHAQPALSAELRGRLDREMDQALLAVPSRRDWRLTLERNPWMRAAAGLLLLAVIAAPVSAVWSLLTKPDREPVVLGFDPAVPESPRTEREDEVADMIQPPLEEDLPVFDQAALEALARSNRLALAGQAWAAQEEAGELGPTLRAKGARVAIDVPIDDDGTAWDRLGDLELWDAFLQQVARGRQVLPPEALFARVETLLAALPEEASVPAGLAAWHWVATGERLAGPSEGWPAAPYRPRD
ncbi:MAG: hypothetical protein ACYTF3_06380 [Planctomycetota bacterium]|jgi:hypothetical protein